MRMTFDDDIRSRQYRFMGASPVQTYPTDRTVQIAEVFTIHAKRAIEFSKSKEKLLHLAKPIPALSASRRVSAASPVLPSLQVLLRVLFIIALQPRRRFTSASPRLSRIQKSRRPR